MIEHVTQALREHEATFKMIFPFYCRLEKFSNREFLSRGMFRKLICDSKLGKRPDDLAQIDVTFATGLKSNPVSGRGGGRGCYCSTRLPLSGGLLAGHGA